MKGPENEKQGSKMEVDEATPQEARVEVQGQKKINVQSQKKTQDYTRKTLAIRQEETDEMGFVPSALSEPREAYYWCGNRCSDEVHADCVSIHSFSTRDRLYII